MKYELPELPEPDMVTFDGDGYDEDAQEIWYFTDAQMRQYAEQAVAPLLAEIERLHEAMDKLLQHCPDAECSDCAEIVCPKGDAFHFHHDGCPSCE